MHWLLVVNSKVSPTDNHQFCFSHPTCLVPLSVDTSHHRSCFKWTASVQTRCKAYAYRTARGHSCSGHSLSTHPPTSPPFLFSLWTEQHSGFFFFLKTWVETQYSEEQKVLPFPPLWPLRIVAFCQRFFSSKRHHVIASLMCSGIFPMTQFWDSLELLSTILRPVLPEILDLFTTLFMATIYGI